MVARRLLLSAALVSALAGPANSQSAPAAASVDPADKIMDLAKRLHKFISLIGDKDEAIRRAALALAIKDGDPTIRTMAVSAYLRRFDALTPEVAPDSSGTVAPEDVPRLAIINVHWSDDGNSFTAIYSGGACATQSGWGAVRGQVAGGKLALNYDTVCVRVSLLPKAEAKGEKGDPLVMEPCQLTMTPNEGGNTLAGPLHCAGMSAVLPVELPFGS